VSFAPAAKSPQIRRCLGAGSINEEKIWVSINAGAYRHIARVSDAETRYQIRYYKIGDDFAAPKKCDADNHAFQKTKPIFYNPMKTFIVQRKKRPLSPKSAENRYNFDIKNEKKRRLDKRRFIPCFIPKVYLS